MVPPTVTHRPARLAQVSGDWVNQFGKSPTRGGFLQVQTPDGGGFNPVAESGLVMGYAAGAGNRAYACMYSWSPGCSAVSYRRASYYPWSGAGYGFGSPYYGGYGLRHGAGWYEGGGGGGRFFGGGGGGWGGGRGGGGGGRGGGRGGS
jgi:hypothetical protein